MKSINMLLEKYAVQVTEENIEALGKWRQDGSISPSNIGMYLLSNYNKRRGWGTFDTELISQFEIIPWELFQQEVLKTTPKTPVYEIY